MMIIYFFKFSANFSITLRVKLDKYPRKDIIKNF